MPSLIKELHLTKRKRIYYKFNGHCAYCGRKMTYKEFTVDHILPKDKGGRTKFNNLFPSCRECNRLKANMTLEEYRHNVFRRRFYFEQNPLPP